MLAALSLEFPGVIRVLEEGEKLGLLRLVRLGPGRRADIPMAEAYILGAWHPVYEDLVVAVKQAQPRSRVIVLWTSSSGEVGLEPQEQEMLNALLDHKAVDAIWFGDRGLAALYHDRGFYAPYPLMVTPRREGTHVGSDYITLMAPPTLKKNLFTQLAAAALIQRQVDYTLHTNVPVPEVLARRLRFTQHEWMRREEYNTYIASSSLNLAVSYAETFNYQAAEAALLGVPSVCSRTIPWAPRQFCVQSINDPEEICQMGLSLVGRGEVFRAAIEAWAERANAEVAAALAKVA